MVYNKEWRSYEELVSLLAERGMIVNDRQRAIHYLERIGYYRLSGYWYSFRERSGVCCPFQAYSRKKKFKKTDTDKILLEQFKQGSSFDLAVDLYVFDKKLRLLTLDALERIEIAFRADISHLLGEKDKFSYLQPYYFFKGFSTGLNSKTGLSDHHAWLTKQAANINRSREEFILFNRRKYGLPLPIWIACEVWDFGTLSTLFNGMKEEDQDFIAQKYDLKNGRTLAKWLRSLNYLRNVCAHHSRLWNRNIIDQPSLKTEEHVVWINSFINNTHALARPFLLLCITNHLLTSINSNSSWWPRLVSLLSNEFPSVEGLGLDLKSIGVVDDWQNLF